MLKGWKKKFSLLAILLSGQAWSLPDIPSFMDCADIIFNAGFQNDSQSSNGTGGLTGRQTMTLFSLGANREYYIYVPSTYDSQKPLPLMIAWHGQAGAGTAQLNAELTRDFWQTTAEANNFIVLAQAGSDESTGSWLPALDYAILNDIFLHMWSLYKIEKTRTYGHGFSAGAHLMHDYVLSNSNEFAGYVISAGTLVAFAGVNAPMNALRPVPIYISIGLTDPWHDTVIQEQDYFIDAGWVENQNYWLEVFNAGHLLDIDVPDNSWEKLCMFSKLQ